MFANILFCLHKYLPCPFLRKDLTLFCPVHENQLISYSTQSQYLKTTPPSDLIQNKLKPASLGTDWIENERFGPVFVKTTVFMPKTGSINSGTGLIWLYQKCSKFSQQVVKYFKLTQTGFFFESHFPVSFRQNMRTTWNFFWTMYQCAEFKLRGPCVRI